MKQILALALVFGISGLVVPASYASPQKVAAKKVVAPQKKQVQARAAKTAEKRKPFDEVEAAKGAQRGGSKHEKEGFRPGGGWDGNNVRISVTRSKLLK